MGKTKTNTFKSWQFSLVLQQQTLPSWSWCGRKLIENISAKALFL